MIPPARNRNLSQVTKAQRNGQELTVGGCLWRNTGPDKGLGVRNAARHVEFLLFHESSEVMKDVSLMHAYENGKHESYGNEGSLCGVFLLFRDNAEYFVYFVSLRDRQSDEETCVNGSGNVW